MDLLKVCYGSAMDLLGLCYGSVVDLLWIFMFAATPEIDEEGSHG